ncbi:hypothetical protein ElyMa_005386700 [Elysia marginata]|uniref:OAR domain-containing protein n=1 Tax=Elysia marginata TaxID=1093978 RepID=A0AAV4EEV4_9GAST|nr:hypothetical protein ElyMa_005386700 [Elysia marginata]
MMSAFEKSPASTTTGGNNASDGSNINSATISNNNNNNDSNASSIKVDGDEEKPQEVLSLLDDDDDGQLALAVAAAVVSSSSSLSPPSSSTFFTSPPSASIPSANVNTSCGNGNISGFQDYGDSILSQVSASQQHLNNHHNHHLHNISNSHHQQQQQQHQPPLQQQQSPRLPLSPVSSGSMATSCYPILPPAYPSNFNPTSSQPVAFSSFTDSLSTTSTPPSSATISMDRSAAAVTAGSIGMGEHDSFEQFLADSDIPSSSLENRMKIEGDLDNILAARKNSLRSSSSGDYQDISASYANSNNPTNCSTYNACAISNIASSNSGGSKHFYRSASDVTNTVISSSSSHAMNMYSNNRSRHTSGCSTLSNINSNNGLDNTNTLNSAYATVSGFTTTTATTTISCSSVTSNYTTSNARGGNLTMTAARQRRASEYGYAQALLSQAPKIAAGVGSGASGSASDLDRASVLRLAQAFVTLQQGKSQDL